MTVRKTVNVQAMLDRANHNLGLTANPDVFNAAYRYGVIDMIEAVLHAANRYKGFTYHGKVGSANFDETRRFYF
jgi:hypothetical protein